MHTSLLRGKTPCPLSQTTHRSQPLHSFFFIYYFKGGHRFFTEQRKQKHQQSYPSSFFLVFFNQQCVGQLESTSSTDLLGNLAGSQAQVSQFMPINAEADGTHQVFQLGFKPGMSTMLLPCLNHYAILLGTLCKFRSKKSTSRNIK